MFAILGSDVPSESLSGHSVMQVLIVTLICGVQLNAGYEVRHIGKLHEPQVRVVAT